MTVSKTRHETSIALASGALLLVAMEQAEIVTRMRCNTIVKLPIYVQERRITEDWYIRADTITCVTAGKKWEDNVIPFTPRGGEAA